MKDQEMAACNVAIFNFYNGLHQGVAPPAYAPLAKSSGLSVINHPQQRRNRPFGTERQKQQP
ncbi:hypothetical protein L1069_14340 [Leisingera sp. MMG025]|nr:hypothetical protein [Leisingera sp. MMG026]